VVFVSMQNLFGIGSTVSIICKFLSVRLENGYSHLFGGVFLGGGVKMGKSETFVVLSV